MIEAIADTLQAAKEKLRKGWRSSKGVSCPCCGQNVKLWPRTIYDRMARSLIDLYWLNLGNQNYYHVRDIGLPEAGGGDFAKLRYWNLIEAMPNDDEKKRTSGYWRITADGALFVSRAIRVPKKAFVFDKRVREFSEETVDIVDALGEKFDYQQLMTRT